MFQDKDMSYVIMEDLLKKIDSRYKLVILASRRATELSDGAQRLVDMSPKVKASTVALEEIRQGRITYKEQKSGE